MTNSFKVPEIGSIWEHLEAPGVLVQVLSIEHITEANAVYVHLALPLGHQTAHISLDLETLYEQYRPGPVDHRPTQWERLLRGIDLE